MKKIVLLGLLLFLFFSCQKEGKIENVERAFYYWKDNSLGQENHSQIEKLKVKTSCILPGVPFWIHSATFAPWKTFNSLLRCFFVLRMKLN